MAEDPFPRERVTATLRRMPAYLRLAWRLARDPLLSRARRAAVIAAAGYLASPIDLVPGVIPVIGQLDDIAFAIAALKVALAGLDPERRREHLSSVGLEDGDLAADLRTVAVASAWLVRAGARTTGRAARTGGRLAVGGARAATKVTVRTVSVASSAASKAAPAAKSVAERAGPAAASARSAASRGAAAASRGASAIRGTTARRPSMRLKVSVLRPPELGPGTTPGDDRLDVEPDVIDPPSPDTGRDQGH
jgi:uncharacterized membrane protein YkvA (DUF1232 family)